MNRTQRTVAEVKLRRTLGAKHRRRRMPRQHPPDHIMRSYARALLAVVKRMRAAYAPLLAALPDLVARVQRERTDSGETGEAKAIAERAYSSMTSSIPDRDLEQLADRFARETATYQRVQFQRQTRAVLGTDLFFPDRRLESLVLAFIDANVGLIKGIGDRLASDIEGATLQALTSGTLHGDLAKTLAGKFGIAEERAKFIARDQVGKIYGQVNAMRQREIGVDAFIWRTVADERVRPEHRARNGEQYTYQEPPAGELPGEPILCRCYAEPVFDSILAGLEDEPSDPEP